MKNFIVSAMVVVASVAPIKAQTVNVHMKDGQVIKYDYDKVEYVDFSAEGKANEIKGAVDLGLSVLWAKCNVGANTLIIFAMKVLDISPVLVLISAE